MFTTNESYVRMATFAKEGGHVLSSGNLEVNPEEVAAPRVGARFSRASKFEGPSPSHGKYSPGTFPSKSMRQSNRNCIS